MAEASITQVDIINNPASFTDPIILEVQYECLNQLRDDLEWQVIYVGSAESSDYDQMLDSALVGPVFAGKYKFRMEAPPPDPAKIPKGDLVGVTALLLTCSYKGKEFVRVGYYVNIDYTDPELLTDPRPDPPILERLQRSIMTEYPRVTKFAHNFDNDAPEELQPAQGEGMGEDDADAAADELEDEEEDEDEDEDEDEEEGEEVDLGQEELQGGQGQENLTPPDNMQEADDMDVDMKAATPLHHQRPGTPMQTGTPMQM